MMEDFGLWFEIQSNNAPDSEHVLNFLSALPGKIEMFVNEDNSNFFDQLRRIESPITKDFFLAALKEATEGLNRSVYFIKWRPDRPFYRVPFDERLTFDDWLNRIGFTGISLRIKAENLNFLWRRILEEVGNVADSIIDFANAPLVKLLRRFFTYLNSILGSLSKVILGADAIKEIKEIIESYLGIADED